MGEYTTNNYFYLPTYKAKGTDEKDKYDAAMEVADGQINTNKTNIATINKEIFSSSYTFADRLSELGSTEYELIINSDITISSNTTVPSNITLQIHEGGKFTISSGVTLTINGTIKAGRYQIFAGSGSVAGSPQFAEGYPEWFGAVGDGTTDDVDAFKSIFSIAAGKVVSLKYNTIYKLTSATTSGHDSIINMAVGSKLHGNDSTIEMHITDEVRGIRPYSYCEIRDVFIKVVSYGSPTGIHQQCITLGDSYTTDGGAHDVLIYNVKLDSNVNNGNSGAIGIYGDCHDIIMDNITIDTNYTLNWGVVMSHWGGSDYFPGNTWDGVNYVKYPYNITLRNSTFKNMTQTDATAIVGGPGITNVVENCFVYNVARAYYATATTVPSNSLTPEQQDIMNSSLVVKDCVFADIRSHGLFLNFEPNTTLGAPSTGEYDNDILVDNCIITGDTTSTVGIYLKYARNLVIQNCSIKNVYKGIKFDGENSQVTIKNNIISNINCSGICDALGTSRNDRIIICDNRIENCNTGSHSDAENNSLIYNRGDYWQITGNILGASSSETAEYAIYCLSGADSTFIANNIVLDINTTAFYMDSSENVLLYNRVASGLTYIDGSNNNQEILRKPRTIDTFTDGDTSPSVMHNIYYKTANTSSTTITTFDDAYTGKQIIVFIEDNNTIFDFTGTNLKGNGGEDWYPSSGDILYAINDGSNWYCTVSSTNDTIPSFMATLGGTNQSVASGTWSKVAFNTEEYDDKSNFDTTNHRFTAPSAGTYTFTTFVQIRDLTDQKTAILSFYKNGSAYKRVDIQSISTSGSIHAGLTGTMTVKLNGGDYIEVYVYHDYGSSRDIDGDTTSGSFFSGARVL